MGNWTAKKIKTFTVEITHKPGDLGSLLEKFRSADANMIAAWAWAQDNRKAYAILIGEKPPQTEEILRNAGKKFEMGDACLCEAGDEIGAFHDILKKVSDAGLNLHAANANGTAGKFSAILWTSQPEYEKLCKTLGC